MYHSYCNKWELSHIPNLTVMIMYCFHNSNPIHFTIIKNRRMIDLKFAFLSMINHSGFDRSFSRIVWPLPTSTCIGGYSFFFPPGLTKFSNWIWMPRKFRSAWSNSSIGILWVSSPRVWKEWVSSCRALTGYTVYWWVSSSRVIGYTAS